jgi:nucleotide-binding universal stress UspA family protein
MYGKILVAVDGTSASSAALAAAVELARPLGAALRLVHVVDMPSGHLNAMQGRVSGDLEESRQAWHRAGQAILDQAVADAGQRGCPAETDLIATDGAHPSERIVEAARRWRADLIVVGTHGRRGVGRLLLGSVAEAVGRTAPVPVLLVRPQNTSATPAAA